MFTSEQSEKPSCLAVSSAEIGNQPTSAMKPSDWISGVQNGKLVEQGEVINGVKTNHFSFDQTNLAVGAYASASGDIWVAQDGGYPVKYVGKATGTNLMLAKGEGTIMWEYSLEDINQLKQIELPPECEAQKPAADIPVPDNATDKASMGTIITFSTPDSPQTVADFYKKELAALDWKEGQSTAMGDFFMLEFSKAQRTLNITITKSEDKTAVVITESQ